MFILEKELDQLRHQIILIGQELDARTRENDHLVTLLEDHEQKLAMHE